MNQLRTQIAALHHKQTRQIKSERAAQTRTKIEYGGLVHKSKLPELLGLSLGDDIHSDPQNWEKEAIILGAAIDAYLKLQEDPTGSYRDHLKRLGIKSLKYGLSF